MPGTITLSRNFALFLFDFASILLGLTNKVTVSEAERACLRCDLKCLCVLVYLACHGGLQS